MKIFGMLLGGALALGASSTLAGQVPAGQNTVTRDQADQIIDELRKIRGLLEKQQAAAPPAKDPTRRAKMNLQNAPMLGDKNAPLTMVEFTDYQCPFCQRFHTQTFAEIKKQYIDTGKLRFYSRDYPLTDMHPDAMRAAQAGRCAGEQGQFWKMRDVMASNPSKLDMASLLADAGDLKLDVPAFRACLESGKHRDGVQTDVLEAMKAGTNATPTFVLGKSTATGVDGELIEGAMPFDFFDLKLKEAGDAK